LVTRSPTLLIGGGFWTGEADWSFRESHARRGNRRRMVAADARDRARALRAFLRIIRGPRRPFWQALHDDRNARASAGRDARRCFLGRVDALSPVARVKTTAGARMRASENRARTHDENKIISRPRRRWNSLAKWGRHPRALVRDSVRFLQRFEFF